MKITVRCYLIPADVTFDTEFKKKESSMISSELACANSVSYFKNILTLFMSRFNTVFY